MKTKDFFDFTFIHAGNFFINKIKSPKKYKWGDKNNTHDHISTCIEFSLEKLDKKTEQAYIITVEGIVVYAGEFSNSFRDRWLKIDNYIWHHKDHLIHQALIEEKEVSLWLTNNPWIETPSGLKLNISKSIEHHILKNNDLLWNQRNN